MLSLFIIFIQLCRVEFISDVILYGNNIATDRKIPLPKLICFILEAHICRLFIQFVSVPVLAQNATLNHIYIFDDVFKIGRYQINIVTI